MPEAPVFPADLPLGVLGYGRFGKAFAQLCQGAGFRVWAYDPRAPVEEALRVPSAGELLARANAIVLAVPLEELGRALAAIQSQLRPDQLVFDVGSVKVMPTETLRARLGQRVPWVATHPLFGPASLARSETLRAAICPNPMHPGAVERVAALYETLGCEVIRVDPHEHDREMAITHALAFFSSKGMLDAGAPNSSRLAPPSYQGMARAIDSVRVDAGHLLGPLHAFNPYAGEARKLLIQHLQRIDRALSETDFEHAAAPPALEIKDLGNRSPELQETRELIDEVDRELLALLARRCRLSKRAGQVKAERGLRIRDPAREKTLLAERRQLATELGLDPDGVEAIFEAILHLSRAVQR